MALALAILVCLAAPDALRTASGETLRGSAVAVEGGYEVSGAAGTRFVSSEDVVWVASEAELRARAKEMLGGADAGALGALRNAQVSAWLAEVGLEKDACRAADRAAALDPECRALPAAIAAIAKVMAEEIREEADAFRLVRIAASGEGARARAADEALGRLDAEIRAKALDRGVRWLEKPVRRYAAEAIGRHEPGAAVEPLAKAAVGDDDEEVRLAAFGSLRAAETGEAVSAVGRQLLVAPRSADRQRAATLLGDMGSPEAVPVLRAALRRAQAASGSGGGPRSHVFFGTQTTYVADFDVEVAQAAAIGEPIVGVIQEGAVLDARVLAARQETVAIVGALRRLGALPAAPPPSK
jgi:hypothetical protein